MIFFFRQHRGQFTLYSLLCLAAATAHTSLAFFMEELSVAALTAAPRVVLTQGAITVAWLIPMLVTACLQAMQAARLNAQYAAWLRTRIVKASFLLSLPSDSQRTQQGSRLEQGIVNDAQMLSGDYMGSFLILLYQSIVLISGFIGIALISPLFILVILGLSTLSWLLPKIAAPALRRTQAETARTRGLLTSDVARYASGIDSLISTGWTEPFAKHLNERIRAQQLAERRRARVRAAVWELTWILGLALHIGVWGCGAYAVIRGWLSLPQVVALAQLSTQVSGPLQEAAESIAMILGARQQAHEVEELTRHGQGRALETACGDLTIDCLSHPHLAASPLSLTVPHGARVLVTGASGIGKTTFLRCLAGLSPHEGTLAFGSESISQEIERSTVLTLATQQAVIVPTRLGENLPQYREDDPLLSTVLSTLPQQDEQTEASQLSGGEARRLHLVNALRSSAPVLLLDEVTAGLDPHSAASVLRAVLHTPRPIIMAVLHDLPDEPTRLGFTHQMAFFADGSVWLSPLPSPGSSSH